MSFASILDKVFESSYQHLDLAYYNNNKEVAKTTGAVCVTVFIIGNMLYCANLGDSRAVLSRRGKAFDLSQDHKA
jgi:protein phosphatase 2C family protein 2/3